MAFTSFVTYFVALTSIGAYARDVIPERYVLPIPPSNTTISDITTEVGNRPLDTVYIAQPNTTSYEWWYFDAVANDLSAAVMFVPVYQGGSFAIDFGIFRNGTAVNVQIPYDEAYFYTNGDGSNTVASDRQWGYRSSPDLSAYEFEIDIPSIGVSGTMQFQSVRFVPFEAGCLLIVRLLLHM
jgi:hypothetical protein